MVCNKEITMKTIIQQSFSLSFKVMKFLKMYPDPHESCFKITQSFLTYFCCVVLIPALAIIHLIFEETDVQNINYNAMFLTQSVCFIVKILPFIISNSELRKCINFFDDQQFAPISLRDERVINNCVLICKRNTKIFLNVLILSLITWLIKPLLLKGYRTPFDLWLPMIETDMFAEISLTYCFIYFITSVGMYLMC